MKPKSIFSTQKVVAYPAFAFAFSAFSSSDGVWVHVLLQVKLKRWVDLECFFLFSSSALVVTIIVTRKSTKITTSNLF